MERMFRSCSPPSNDISLRFPEAAFTSDSFMARLSKVPESFLRPPVDVGVNISTSAFPTGTFSAQLFCNMVLGRPSLQDASITRIDWLEMSKWPLYHQYLLVEISHENRTYMLRIETLGLTDRQHGAAVRAFALNVLGAGSEGNSKYQVQVSEPSPTDRSDYEPVRQKSATLLLSMANENDWLFRELANESLGHNRWYFTLVLPSASPSQTTYRGTPKLKHLCLTLRSITQRAPDYKLGSFNCYFLSRALILGVWELSAPLPRMTWSLSAMFHIKITSSPFSWLRLRSPHVPWLRLFLPPKSRLFTTKPCVLQLDYPTIPMCIVPQKCILRADYMHFASMWWLLLAVAFTFPLGLLGAAFNPSDSRYLYLLFIPSSFIFGIWHSVRTVRSWGKVRTVLAFVLVDIGQ
ncbi:hypothetical protein FRC12_008867 [Ceratobasidium sp. 428]|nr:hypothetical protein FRC12_008867 [Ceratobasidium sp. 428]